MDSATIKLASTDSLNFKVRGVINQVFFARGFKKVFSRPYYRIARAAENTWFKIELDSTFAHDPTKSLILDVTFKDNPGATFSTQGQGDFSRSMRAYSSNLSDTTGSSSSNTIPHFGIEYVDPSATFALAGATRLLAWPSPASSSIAIAASKPGKQLIELRSATGSLVLRTQTDALGAAQLQTAHLAKGVYYVSLGLEKVRVVLQ